MRLGCPHCAHAQWLRRAPRQSCGASERVSGSGVQLSGFCGSLREAAPELGISRKGKGREGWGGEGGQQVGEGRGSGLHLAGSCRELAAGDSIRPPAGRLLCSPLGAAAPASWPGSLSSAGSSLPSAGA